jgi:MoxR-like ATPase
VLAALEELTFYVPEIDTRFTAKSANQPLVVLTSNSEKNLPDAFLRRVAYHHISFPGPERLLAIVSAKVAGYSKEQLEPLIDHFLEIRSSDYNLKKIPATAELIQWAYFLQSAGFDPAQLEQSQKSAEVQGILHSSYAVLAKTKEDLAALRKQAK